MNKYNKSVPIFALIILSLAVFSKIINRHYSLKTILLCMTMYTLYFYVNTILHEAYHCTVLKHRNMKIAVVYFPFFTMYKKDKWKAYISIQNGLNGMVIPNIDSVVRYKEFRTTVLAYRKSLVLAQLLTYLQNIVVSGCLFLGFKYYDSDILFLLAGFVVFISTLDFLSSFLSNSNNVEDMAAYNQFKNEDFAAAMILTDNVFSSNYRKNIEPDSCLRSKGMQYLISIDLCTAQDYEMDIFNLLLCMFLSGDWTYLEESIGAKLDDVYEFCCSGKFNSTRHYQLLANMYCYKERKNECDTDKQAMLLKQLNDNNSNRPSKEYEYYIEKCRLYTCQDEKQLLKMLTWIEHEYKKKPEEGNIVKIEKQSLLNAFSSWYP